MRVDLYDVKADEFIEALAKKLREIEELKQPEWALWVKTSHAKERPPERADWWYIRAASILRKIYLKGVLGVNRLRKEYTHRKNRGMQPAKTFAASGKIIRCILQKAEEAGLLKKAEGKRKGRMLTEEAKRLMQEVVMQIKSKNK